MRLHEKLPPENLARLLERLDDVELAVAVRALKNPSRMFLHLIARLEADESTAYAVNFLRDAAEKIAALGPSSVGRPS